MGKSRLQPQFPITWKVLIMANTPRSRALPLKMSQRLLSGMTAALLIGGGLTAVNMATVNESTPGGSAFAAETDQPGTCGPITVAYLIDFSNSFNERDFNAMMNEARKSVEQMSSIDGLQVNVKLIPFNITSPAAFDVLQGDIDYAAEVGEGFQAGANTVNTGWRTSADHADWRNDPAKRQIVQTVNNVTGPTQVFDSGDSAAVEEAFASLHRDAGLEWDGGAITGGGSATNWHDALNVAQEDPSITDVILMTDGVPNGYRDASGKFQTGSAFPNTSEDVMGPSEEAADRLMEGADGQIGTDDDVKLYGVGVNGAYGQGVFESTLQRITGYGDDLGKVGLQYYMNDASNLTNSIVNLAVQRCDATVQIHKGANEGADLTPGGEVTFTVTARATGQIPSTNVQVHELEGLNIVPGSATFSDPSKGEIVDGVWNVGKLDVAEEQTVTVTAQIAEEWRPGQDIVNDVTITSDRQPEQVTDGEPNDSAEEDTDRWDRDVITSDPAASALKIHKESNTAPEDLAPGEASDYTITVKNDGPDTARDITVTEAPKEGLDPESVAFVEDSASQGDFEGLTWNVGTLAPGETATIKVTGILTEAAVKGVTNAATVENPENPVDPEGECVPNDDVDSDTDQCDTVTVVPPTALQVDKTHTTEPEAVEVGGEVTYDIDARNNSKFGADDVIVTDLPLEGLDPESVTLWVDGEQLEDADAEAEGFQWLVGSMDPGEIVTAQVRANLVEDVDLEVFRNAVVVSNPDHPKDPSGDPENCVPNEGDVTTDDDQCDVTEDPMPEPPAEEEPPAPEQPEEPKPEDPQDPTPVDPPKADAPKVNTGGDAGSEGLIAGGVLAALGTALLGGLGLRKFRAAKGGSDSE